MIKSFRLPTLYAIDWQEMNITYFLLEIEMPRK